MGCFKIGGKIRGAQDGGVNISLPACYRAKSTRAKLGCDEAVPDADMLSNIDSAFATKVVGALAAKLDPQEMGRVLDILKDADILTDEEARAVNEALAPPADTPEGAMDSFAARYPGASRIVTAPGGMLDEQRHRDMQARRATALPKMSAAAVKRSSVASDAIQNFAARYPGAARIRRA